MMKTITGILSKILMCSIFFITICCSDEYLNLSKDQKFAFSKSDTLVYVSNLNNKDSFKIEEISTDYTVYDKQNHIQFQSISIKPIGKTSISDASYTNRYYSCVMIWGDFQTSFLLEEKHTITCTFNNKVFENVYKLSKNPYASRDGETIFYSYKYGVIQYKSNNETFILSLK